jgi:hypothetical protein
MTVEVGEVRLVVTCAGAFILASAVATQEPLRHTILTQLLGMVWVISAFATLVEAGSPKNDE